jgi:3-hydroxybutyryl-CoA dehydratase
MPDFYADIVGLQASFRKTVSESDVYLFAGITGDFSPNHVDEEFMRKTQYGRRIAHGALLIGYMSRASTMIAEKCKNYTSNLYPVSLGYDKIRFLKPVFINDTISVTYSIAGCDRERNRSLASIEMTKSGDEIVASATHVMKWLED